MGHSQESNLYPNGTRVPNSMFINALRLTVTRSNRLLTSGWWRFSRKPVRSLATNLRVDGSNDVPGM